MDVKVDQYISHYSALASMSKKRFRHFAVIHETMKENVKDDTVPEEAMRCVLSIKDILKSYARNASAVAEQDSTFITTGTILRDKSRKFKIILNTRLEDDVPVSAAVEEMVGRTIVVLVQY